MKKATLFYIAVCAVSCFLFASCGNTTKGPSGADSLEVDTVAVRDSTVYGVCGDGTMMNTVQLITDAGDTLSYIVSESEDGSQHVLGGLLAGDRLAVVEGEPLDGERTAARVINLTTLQGHWTSLDKNFVIMEGGRIQSELQAEKNPWTTWKILNGNLLLGRDTFSIYNLGSDSLCLENKEGIFAYKRIK